MERAYRAARAMNLSQVFESSMTANFMRETRNEGNNGTFVVSWDQAFH
jgi:hypothetical protein